MSTISRLHFTYATPDVKCLQQGDLLARTPALESLLKLVHPHYYSNDSYRLFLVITQSCDLVCRDGGQTKARYITLCGVRPAQLAIIRELDLNRTKFEIQAGIAAQKRQGRVREFLTRLYNNNESSYFYLHEEPALGIDEPYCAFLPLSIAIRSSEHYQTCANAKIASLSDVFQAKLGWLVGNLYSRVGTPDWAPSVESNEELKNRIQHVIDGLCKWEDDKRVEQAEKEAREKNIIEPNEVLKLLAKIKIPTRRERVIESLRNVLANEDLLGDKRLAARDIDLVLRALASNADFKSATN